jgi:hypothetical protein
MNNYKEEDINKKVAKVVHLICNNPAVYFSEMDVHVLMMKALMDIDCFDPFAKWKKGLKITSRSIGVDKNKKEESPDTYRTMLIHKEYGHRSKPKAKSDIVIFDELDVKSIDDPINLKSDGEYLKPKYIFEFGTEKISGKDKKKYTDHVKNDLEKLSECKVQGRGFLIHIHRNDAQGKNDETIEKYQNEIKDAWESWKTKVGEDKIKVKVLIFFVEIGVPNRVKSSKAQMFNPYPKSNKAADWLKVNLKVIEKITMNFLKEDISDLAEIIKSVKQK